MARRRFHYRVSGLELVSDRPLEGLEELPRRRSATAWSLTKARRTSPPRTNRFRVTRLGSGTIHVAWPGNVAFWIRPKSHRVEYAVSPRLSPAVFFDLFVNPTLSFLLRLEGCEPLHASVVQIGRSAVGFLGQPGAGKSTVAASFVLSGYGLVTDDLLAVRWRHGRPWVMPGYPEIRLWPRSGNRLVPEFSQLPRVVPTASKRRLDPRAWAGGFIRTPVPLRALYELRWTRSASAPHIEPLASKDAFLALTRNLYNTALLDPATLNRQFQALGRLAQRVPVRQLLLPRAATNPKDLPRLILNDLRKIPHGAGTNSHHAV